MISQSSDFNLRGKTKNSGSCSQVKKKLQYVMRVIEQKHVFIYRFIISNLVKVISFIKSVENSLKQESPNCQCLKRRKSMHFFLNLDPHIYVTFSLVFAKL